MAIIKCKMCGGDIEISADKTFGTCEYCGSTMTLPKTDDDQRLSLFNRGTHLRRNGEFDKAAAIYERLIGENDADAEAHWNLLLCRYGIEYVQDPASGERAGKPFQQQRKRCFGGQLRVLQQQRLVLRIVIK